MMAIGELNVQQYFAALYAHTDTDAEPSSGGRQMGGHYATRFLNNDGSWKDVMSSKNSSSDISSNSSGSSGSNISDMSSYDNDD
jgi:hypothetical protein